MLRTHIARAFARTRTTLDDEVGDVPGWVLITLMTAGLPMVTDRG